jgi:hypothetical protein
MDRFTGRAAMGKDGDTGTAPADDDRLRHRDHRRAVPGCTFILESGASITLLSHQSHQSHQQQSSM